MWEGWTSFITKTGIETWIEDETGGAWKDGMSKGKGVGKKHSVEQIEKGGNANRPNKEN